MYIFFIITNIAYIIYDDIKIYFNFSLFITKMGFSLFFCSFLFKILAKINSKSFVCNFQKQKKQVIERDEKRKEFRNASNAFY